VIHFWYTNHRGQRELRHVSEPVLHRGSHPEYYPTERWLISGHDSRADAPRSFDVTKMEFVEDEEGEEALLERQLNFYDFNHEHAWSNDDNA
jgi:hypothetical protein